MKNLGIILVLTLVLYSCVPQKKYQEQEALAKRHLSQKIECQNELEITQQELADLKEQHADLQEKYNNLKSEYDKLVTEKAELAKTLNDLKLANDMLTDKQREIIEASSKRQEQLTKELADKKRELDLKESELESLSKSLKDREDKLSELLGDVDAKTRRIHELEASLAAKDSALAQLKNKITDALKGFTSDELTVEEKNGKIYVSMSEKLLFKSGSFTVDSKGEDALAKIAEVLKKQTDVDIIVEGHTDNVPYRGSGQLSDNWDLSVKRATSIVKVLLDNSNINPSRITAAGRGPYHPVDPAKTTEARSKNRRTEIILTPKLDILYEIMEER